MPLNVDSINAGTISQGGNPVKPYKVYTALLTQSGTDTESTINSGSLIIGVTYTVNQNSPGMDFTNVGAPNNNLGTRFVATGTIPNSWGEGATYTLAYSEGTPVVTVLENTIGNIWFTYEGVGRYVINSNNLFTPNKTFLLNGTSLGMTMFNKMINTDGSGILNNVGYVINWNGISSIGISSFIDNEIYGDDVLNGLIPIEIRVYN